MKTTWLTMILTLQLSLAQSQYDITRFNKDNSDLPHNFVFSVNFDTVGNTWFGLYNNRDNDGGPVRFDGTNWDHLKMDTKYTYANNVSDILFAPDGFMYICGYGASVGSRITQWLNEDEWTDISPVNMYFVARGLVHDNSLWFIAQYSSLYEYKLSTGTWQVHSGIGSGYPNGGFDLDEDGVFWIGNAKGRLIRFKDEVLDEVQIYPYEQGVNKAINAVKANKEDGSIWVGGSEGLAHVDSLGNKTLYNEENTGMPLEDIVAIAFDSVGNMWIGSINRGLIIWDGVNYQVFSTSTLGSQIVRDIQADAAGNMWVTTWGGGVTVFERQPVAVDEAWSYKAVSIVPTVIQQGDSWEIVNPSNLTLKSFQLFADDGRLLTQQAINTDHNHHEINSANLVQGKYIGRITEKNGKVYSSILIVH